MAFYQVFRINLANTFEKFAMSAPVPLGCGFDAALPRKLRRKPREFRPAWIAIAAWTENIFDALKDQAGWGGFVRPDLARWRLAARRA